MQESVSGGDRCKAVRGRIASGDFAGALETIRKHMPFPSVCGRICLHPCETECARGDVDQPIAIMHLKRFASDYESQKGEAAPLPSIAEPTGKKVAIIGSGPSGLTAAHDLALKGHKVTVFERAEIPGGMLTRAIPEFHLPSKAVLKDIERIEKLGVEIKLGHPIDNATGIKDLLADGFGAVLVATGASGKWAGLKGNGWIEGSELHGVQGAVDFMISHRKCRKSDVKDAPCKVAVLGYGVQALECARTAIRLGAEEVDWIIPFDREELQPDARLVKLAEDEGVMIVERMRPIAIEGADGKVTGVRCARVELGEPDHTGRRFRHEIPNSQKVISVRSVIDAAYLAPDLSSANLSSGPWNTITVNLDTMATSIAGVFAAGDVATGAKSALEAIALGHRAAAGIDAYLAGGENEIGTLSEPIRIHGWEMMIR